MFFSKDPWLAAVVAAALGLPWSTSIMAALAMRANAISASHEHRGVELAAPSPRAFQHPRRTRGRTARESGGSVEGVEVDACSEASPTRTGAWTARRRRMKCGHGHLRRAALLQLLVVWTVGRGSGGGRRRCRRRRRCCWRWCY